MADKAGQDSAPQKTGAAEDAHCAVDPDEPPECFGDPDKVCPTGDEGFIVPQERCVGCRCLQRCLQLGLQARGLLSLVEEPEPPKVSGFLKRWSDQKIASSSQEKSKK